MYMYRNVNGYFFKCEYSPFIERVCRYIKLNLSLEENKVKYPTRSFHVIYQFVINQRVFTDRNTRVLVKRQRSNNYREVPGSNAAFCTIRNPGHR